MQELQQLATAKPPSLQPESSEQTCEVFFVHHGRT